MISDSKYISLLKIKSNLPLPTLEFTILYSHYNQFLQFSQIKYAYQILTENAQKDRALVYLPQCTVFFSNYGYFLWKIFQYSRLNLNPQS
jgi:hypothetical protein